METDESSEEGSEAPDEAFGGLSDLEGNDMSEQCMRLKISIGKFKVLNDYMCLCIVNDLFVSTT